MNQGAVQQEQMNQEKAQQYAAAQQKQALEAVNSWIAKNGPPQAGHAPMTPPVASSPATMGGGTIPAGQSRPAAAPQAAQPQAAPPPPGAPAIPPQVQALLQAALRGQTGPPLARPQ